MPSSAASIFRTRRSSASMNFASASSARRRPSAPTIGASTSVGVTVGGVSGGGSRRSVPPSLTRSVARPTDNQRASCRPQGSVNQPSSTSNRGSSLPSSLDMHAVSSSKVTVARTQPLMTGVLQVCGCVASCWCVVSADPFGSTPVQRGRPPFAWGRRPGETCCLEGGRRPPSSRAASTIRKPALPDQQIQGPSGFGIYLQPAGRCYISLGTDVIPVTACCAELTGEPSLSRVHEIQKGEVWPRRQLGNGGSVYACFAPSRVMRRRLRRQE